jgi:hypothetical protein
MDQLPYSMGLERREVRILAPKATIPSKGFLEFEGSHFIFLYILQYGINTEYFSTLQVKNKSHVGVMNVHYTWPPLPTIVWSVMNETVNKHLSDRSLQIII